MNLFSATLSQMGYLLAFIALGFALMKFRALPKSSASVISKLENNLLLPAMVFYTFSNQFTLATLKSAWKSLLISAAVAVVSILISVCIGRFLCKDRYLKNISVFGLCFSNFAFMGYAVVQALFPEFYMQYLIFTMPFWAAVYLWGVPALLIAESQEGQGLRQRLKSFLNPMFVCMLVGALFGLADLTRFLPDFVQNVIASTQSCMSPLAMMLAGITLSEVKLKSVFGRPLLYVVSLIRLVAFPLLFLALARLLPLSRVDFVCALVVFSMPVSLTSIVIPAAYGKDTSMASGMALISHVISCITIPIIFTLGI